MLRVFNFKSWWVSRKSCDEMGIVAPVAEIAGAIQANLLINDLLERDELFKDYFIKL